MLGLGNYISNDSVSGGTPGYFEIVIDSLASANTRLNLTAHAIGHANDSDANDDDPGILLSKFKIEYNDSPFSYNFNSSYISNTPLISGTVSVTNDSLSFADTQYGTNTPWGSQTLYNDTTTDFSSLAAGGKLKMSGIVTLNDGTGNVYDPGVGGGSGRIDFQLRSGFTLSVYINPNYSGSLSIVSTKVSG